ncbi:polysaccharide deacetylase [Thermococcus sp. P6]|nr:polysaccharide deacetylase [Thermococcus sp. P6]
MKLRLFIMLIVLISLLPIGIIHREDSPTMEYEVSSITTAGYENYTSYKALFLSSNFSSPNMRLSNSKPAQPIIFLHDVTPRYFMELRKVVKIIDRHNYSSRTVLFVIPRFDPPHYGDKWDLRRNPHFVSYLHELQAKGYRIELHGYEHTFHEFNCSYAKAGEKLENATFLMESVGFGNFSLFLPPAWALNNESIDAIEEYNLTTIMPDYFILPNGSIKRVWNHEYTWYIERNETDIRVSMALRDYNRTSRAGIPFYLSLHPQTIIYGGGLKFLDEFLNAMLQINP